MSKSKCCKKYRRKSKACSSCPLMARLAKGDRQAMLARYAGDGSKDKGKKKVRKKKAGKKKRRG
ncbi:MAG: hypothetical protein MI919_40775 [Holophagales bacterium]|nr:hypothetical protein [Holophagales bacterium]